MHIGSHKRLLRDQTCSSMLSSCLKAMRGNVSVLVDFECCVPGSDAQEMKRKRFPMHSCIMTRNALKKRIKITSHHKTINFELTAPNVLLMQKVIRTCSYTQLVSLVANDDSPQTLRKKLKMQDYWIKSIQLKLWSSILYKTFKFWVQSALDN